MHGHSGHVNVQRMNFAIELQTADPQHPLLRFSMMNRGAAETWDARLDAIFNG